MNEKIKVRVSMLMTTLVLLLAIGLAGCTPSPTPTPTAIPPSPTATLEPPTATPPPPTDTPEPPTATPEPPTATPPPPPKPTTDPADRIDVLAGNKLSVQASAEGATGYRWALQGDGEISSDEGEIILYTAPEQAVPGGTMAILTVVASSAHGESPPANLEINVVASEAAIVKLETLGIPAGWMSGGDNPADFINLESGPDNCPADAGPTCLKFTYETGGGWGGVYWWPPACGGSGTPDAWERVTNGKCGINVLAVGNLSAVNSLTFRARGEQGREVIEFKIGGADVEPMPGRSTGKVTLTQEWQPYTLDLENLDLTNAIGLFLWVAADPDNSEKTVFYLDAIQFEGVK